MYLRVSLFHEKRIIINVDGINYLLRFLNPYFLSAVIKIIDSGAQFNGKQFQYQFSFIILVDQMQLFMKLFLYRASNFQY